MFGLFKRKDRVEEPAKEDPRQAAAATISAMIDALRPVVEGRKLYSVTGKGSEPGTAKIVVDIKLGLYVVEAFNSLAGQFENVLTDEQRFGATCNALQKLFDLDDNMTARLAMAIIDERAKAVQHVTNGVDPESQTPTQDDRAVAVALGAIAARTFLDEYDAKTNTGPQLPAEHVLKVRNAFPPVPDGPNTQEEAASGETAEDINDQAVDLLNAVAHSVGQAVGDRPMFRLPERPVDSGEAKGEDREHSVAVDLPFGVLLCEAIDAAVRTKFGQVLNVDHRSSILTNYFNFYFKENEVLMGKLFPPIVEAWQDASQVVRAGVGPAEADEPNARRIHAVRLGRRIAEECLAAYEPDSNPKPDISAALVEEVRARLPRIDDADRSGSGLDGKTTA